MTCEQAWEKINEELDGQLSAEEITELHLHLEQCPSCKKDWHATQLLIGLGGASYQEPPQGLAERVVNHLKADEAARRPEKRHVPFSVFLAAAAVFIMIMTFQGDIDWLGQTSDMTPRSAEVDGVMDTQEDQEKSIQPSAGAFSLDDQLEPEDLLKQANGSVDFILSDGTILSVDPLKAMSESSVLFLTAVRMDDSFDKDTVLKGLKKLAEVGCASYYKANEAQKQSVLSKLSNDVWIEELASDLLSNSADAGIFIFYTVTEK